MSTSPARDWTDGAPKWAAVGVLGCASITGIVWSIAHQAPRVPIITYRESPPALAPHAEQSPAVPGAPPLAPAKINLNTATGAELENLPGVGPALAARIIEHRKAHGPFRSVEQLDGVKGIGPKLMEKIRPLATVGDRAGSE